MKYDNLKVGEQYIVTTRITGGLNRPINVGSVLHCVSLTPQRYTDLATFRTFTIVGDCGLDREVTLPPSQVANIQRCPVPATAPSAKPASDAVGPVTGYRLTTDELRQIERVLYDVRAGRNVASDEAFHREVEECFELVHDSLP